MGLLNTGCALPLEPAFRYVDVPSKRSRGSGVDRIRGWMESTFIIDSGGQIEPLTSAVGIRGHQPVHLPVATVGAYTRPHFYVVAVNEQRAFLQNICPRKLSGCISPAPNT